MQGGKCGFISFVGEFSPNRNSTFERQRRALPVHRRALQFALRCVNVSRIARSKSFHEVKAASSWRISPLRNSDPRDTFASFHPSITHSLTQSINQSFISSIIHLIDHLVTAPESLSLSFKAQFTVKGMRSALLLYFSSLLFFFFFSSHAPILPTAIRSCHRSGRSSVYVCQIDKSCNPILWDVLRRHLDARAAVGDRASERPSERPIDT